MKEKSFFLENQRARKVPRAPGCTINRPCSCIEIAYPGHQISAGTPPLQLLSMIWISIYPKSAFL
jgi:hypothetical protein